LNAICTEHKASRIIQDIARAFSVTEDQIEIVETNGRYAAHIGVTRGLKPRTINNTLKKVLKTTTEHDEKQPGSSL